MQPADMHLGSDVGGVLDRLDARANNDALARESARLIRRLLEQLSTAESEYVETEFSRMAWIDEADRALNMRRVFEERRQLKAARR